MLFLSVYFYIVLYFEILKFNITVKISTIRSILRYSGNDIRYFLVRNILG
jgi:hypothetical protein